jgi:hypothetical protein
MSHTRLGALAPALALVATAAVVSAFWTASGQASNSATVATLGAPTITSATTGAETVALSWSAVTPPGEGTVEYYVTRDGSTASAGCPSSSSHSTATNCTDTNVPVGAHKYKITAVWRSWTSTGVEQTVTVAYGPATHLVLEAASLTPTAGEADNLTILAKDASNDTVGTYTGAHGLIFEGANETGGEEPVVTDRSGVEKDFGEETEITFTEGKATVSSTTNGVMKLYKAEAAHVKVKEGSLNNSAGLAVTVKAAAAKNFKVPTPTEQEAGVSFNVTLTAIDEWGNTATSYTGKKTIAWSEPANSPSGKAPSYTASVTFTAGVGAAASTKLYDAQTTTLKAKEGTTIEGTSGSFTVKAATAKKFTVPTPSEQEAGVAFNVTLTVTDEYGNLAKSYTGAKTIAWSGPSSSPNATAPEYPTAATAVTFTEGVGTASSLKLSDAQSTTLKAKEGTIEGVTGSFTVRAAAAERFAWAHAAVSAGKIEGTCLFACTTSSIGASKKFTAHASVTDAYANIVSSLGATVKAKVEKASGEGTLTNATGLSIPASGLAESAMIFEYTSPASGASEAVLKLKPEEAIPYTEAEAHVKY